MDLIADRGRRVSVDELNTTQLLAHARKEANRRKLDDVLIVDVDAHHYENEHMSEILPFMENDVFRQLSMHGPHARQSAAAGDRLSGHGRPRDALSAASVGKDRPQGARRPARPPLDGRHERRLLLPVSDRHAVDRLASAEGNGIRTVLGLQPLAHRKGAAGIRRPLLLDALSADLGRRRRAAHGREIRRLQGRHRLHDHDGAQLCRCTTTR